jgi:GNAT superfamily N-acetyltransferase
MICINPVRSAHDLNALRELFREYVIWLGIDLSFQDFESEFKSLPGKYRPPYGELFLASRENSDQVGCVGVAPMNKPGACEMKRLYVRPDGRGYGTGRVLATAAVVFAESSGYQEMMLDTLPTMPAALAVYRSLGFREIPHYYANPVSNALFFMKEFASQQEEGL